MHIIILRGISGAGKSTWITKNHPEATVVSADHTFIQPDGSYQFRPEKLQEAHEACFRSFLEAIQRHDSVIIVDNSNITAWEMSPYVLGGKALGYSIEIITLECDPAVASSRKNWVASDIVHKKALQLSQETKTLPPFMRALHRTIRTDIV